MWCVKFSSSSFESEMFTLDALKWKINRIFLQAFYKKTPFDKLLFVAYTVRLLQSLLHFVCLTSSININTDANTSDISNIFNGNFRAALWEFLEFVYKIFPRNVKTSRFALSGFDVQTNTRNSNQKCPIFHPHDGRSISNMMGL